MSKREPRFRRRNLRFRAGDRQGDGIIGGILDGKADPNGSADRNVMRDRTQLRPETCKRADRLGCERYRATDSHDCHKKPDDRHRTSTILTRNHACPDAARHCRGNRPFVQRQLNRDAGGAQERFDRL